MAKANLLEPDERTKKRLYQFYELIFDSGFAPAKKRSVMTGVLGYEVWSWRVVGISEDAIKTIARNGFKHPARTLSRDHVVPRGETYYQVFESKFSFNEWWELVWKNDKTILITNTEHRGARKRGRIYPVDPNQGLFTCNRVAGWRHRKSIEGAFIKSLCEHHGINY